MDDFILGYQRFWGFQRFWGSPIVGFTSKFEFHLWWDFMDISWEYHGGSTATTFKSWDITPITKLVYLLPYFSLFSPLSMDWSTFGRGFEVRFWGKCIQANGIILPFFRIQHIWNHQTSVKNEARSKSMSNYNAQMRTTGRCLGFLCRQIFQHHGVVTSTSIHWFGSTIHRCWPATCLISCHAKTSV